MATTDKPVWRVFNQGDQPIILETPAWVEGEWQDGMLADRKKGKHHIDEAKTNIFAWKAWDKTTDQPYLDLTDAQWTALQKSRVVCDTKPRPAAVNKYFRGADADVKKRGLLDMAILRVQPI
jgi:hypothetical protein